VYARPRDAQMMQQQYCDTSQSVSTMHEYKANKHVKNDQLLHWSDVEVYALLGLLNAVTVDNVRGDV
jgi:hypothetical protein